MAQPLLTFEVMGEVQLSRGLSRFAEDVKDLREPFREIIQQLYDIERQQFDTEGGRAESWQPLAPSTVERKERGGFGSKILVRTEAMESSLTGQTTDTRVEVQPLLMRFGTKVPYAGYHQTGTTHMPARPVIKLIESDKLAIMKTLHRYLVKQAKKEFAGLAPTAGAGKKHVGGS